MSIDRYVTSLRAHLALPPERASEVAEEVRAHLEDAARDLQMAGLTATESERAAVSRFGPPDEIAAAMARSQRRGPRRARGALAVLAAAAILGMLGGSAAASAHTTPRTAGWRSTMVATLHHPAPPVVAHAIVSGGLSR